MSAITASSRKESPAGTPLSQMKGGVISSSPPTSNRATWRMRSGRVRNWGLGADIGGVSSKAEHPILAEPGHRVCDGLSPPVLGHGGGPEAARQAPHGEPGVDRGCLLTPEDESVA